MACSIEIEIKHPLIGEMKIKADSTNNDVAYSEVIEIVKNAFNCYYNLIPDKSGISEVLVTNLKGSPASEELVRRILKETLFSVSEIVSVHDSLVK